MYCKKCSGRMFVERINDDNSFVEVFCTACGSRKILDKNNDNFFIKWLIRKEQVFRNSLAI